MTDALARRLGLGDAVVIGLGSMIGAGVFAAFAPAARAAGTGLLLGLVVAAVVAFCNATSSAQLAAQYPTSGGTYVYGRERLGPWWGFAAGWAFVVGKTASCAAMALTSATYVAPDRWWLQRSLAVTAVVALAGLNLRGITRTAAVTRVIVTVVLTCLATTAVGLLVAGDLDPIRLGGAGALTSAGGYRILQSAGLLFFAFAGYARIATLGEEVRDPARTIPRAVVLALGVTVAVYAVLAVLALLAAGPDRLAATSAPLAAAVDAAGVEGLTPVVRAGAVLASLGALLALMTGIGRTTLAMARERDLPGWLAAVDARHRVPRRAEVTLAVVVGVLVVTTDLRGVIGFSSLGVLVYYAVANLAAIMQGPADRRWPRAVQVLGLAGCVTLAATLPVASLVAGVGVLVVGLAGRAVAHRRWRPPPPCV